MRDLNPQFKVNMERYGVAILLPHSAAMLWCKATILWYRSGTPGKPWDRKPRDGNPGTETQGQTRAQRAPPTRRKRRALGHSGLSLGVGRNAQLFGHADEVRQRGRLHLLHGSAPVQLDGGRKST